MFHMFMTDSIKKLPLIVDQTVISKCFQEQTNADNAAVNIFLSSQGFIFISYSFKRRF